jgi:hypothetical protein
VQEKATRVGRSIMKNWQKALPLAVLAAIGIGLTACGSKAVDVPSLKATPTAAVEDVVLDDEAKVMAFVQCMRDQGIEFEDPVVDSEGNVQRPEFVEGFTITREQLAEPYAACSHHLEGLSFGRRREAVSAQVDQFVKLATCLRDKGYDMDDPTAETLEVWMTDFRVEFDWDDPAAMEAYQECSSAD